MSDARPRLNATSDDATREDEVAYLVSDGSDLMRAGRVEEALSELDRALELKPDDEQAQNLRGLCLFRLHRLEEAAQVYAALVVENPSEPALRLNQAMVAMKQGDLAVAHEALSTVLRVSPGHARAQALLAAVNERMAPSTGTPHAGDVTTDALPAAGQLDPGVALPPVDAGPLVPPPPLLDDAVLVPVEEPALGGAGAPPAPAVELAPAPPPLDDAGGPEDDFSELNDDEDRVERTLPAYDLSAFEAHLRAKDGARGKPAPEAALPPPTPPPKAAAEPPPAPAKPLSHGAEAAALAAASAALLQRKDASPPAAVSGRASLGFSVDDAPTERPRAPAASAVTSFAALVDRQPPIDHDEHHTIALAIKDVLYLRTDRLVALSGELEVEPVNRRYRGRRTDSLFGGTQSPLAAAMGMGSALLDTRDGETVHVRLAGDDAYLLERSVLAFTDGIVWENGRLPGEDGDDLDIVHLRGDGRVVLLVPRPTFAVAVEPGAPVTLHASRLVGWQGQLVPYRGPFPGLPESAERPAIVRFEGTGLVVVS